MLLVTGATGFIGKNLIPELIKRGRLRILARRTSNVTLFRTHRDIEIAYGDLEENRGIDEALQGIDTVIHCAARTIGKNFIEYYKTNTIGTAHLIEAMNKEGTKKILYLSSNAACGPCCEKKPLRETDRLKPISSYGRSKKLAEDIIMKNGINYIILRPVAVYGPYDEEILRYIKLLNHGLCPIIGFGDKYINLLYITDLVQLITTLVQANRFNNQTYFVNDGHCYAYEEVLEQIACLLQKDNFKIHIPQQIAQLCGLFSDIFLPPQRRLIWRDKVKELAEHYWLCHNERLVTACGFVPRFSLEHGMRETITWYREHNYLK